jgi:hypothetical protein
MTYIINAPIGFGLSLNAAYVGATIITIVIIVLFFIAAKKNRENNLPLEVDVSNWSSTK